MDSWLPWNEGKGSRCTQNMEHLPGDLLLTVWSSLSSTTSVGNGGVLLLEMQNLKSCPRLPESEAAFPKIPQGIQLHLSSF